MAAEAKAELRTRAQSWASPPGTRGWPARCGRRPRQMGSWGQRRSACHQRTGSRRVRTGPRWKAGGSGGGTRGRQVFRHLNRKSPLFIDQIPVVRQHLFCDYMHCRPLWCCALSHTVAAEKQKLSIFHLICTERHIIHASAQHTWLDRKRCLPCHPPRLVPGVLEAPFWHGS